MSLKNLDEGFSYHPSGIFRLVKTRHRTQGELREGLEEKKYRGVLNGVYFLKCRLLKRTLWILFNK